MNKMINIVIILVILVNIDCLPYPYPYQYPYEYPYNTYGYPYSYGRSAWAYSTDVNLRCFSGDSFVKLSNGQDKQIGHLKSGDEMLTISQSNISSTEMIIMLDKQISKQALFYTLKTLSGHQISLTEYHLIPIKSLNGNKNYLFAKQIQIGNLLFVLINNKIEYSPVINITIQLKKGYYAPLTTKGTLFVNNILSSCFAHTNNHYFAQFYMFPLRFYYKLTKFIYINDLFNNQTSEGLHWIIRLMIYFARYFRPDTLIC